MSNTLKGALIGLVAGPVLGYLVVTYVASTAEHEDIANGALLLGLYGLLPGLLIGPVIGAFIGALVGWDDGWNGSSREQRGSFPDSRNTCANCGCQVADDSETCEWCGAQLK